MKLMMLVVCAGIALSWTERASGQLRSWANPVSGLWRTPSNWSGDVPDTTGEDARLGWGGPFTVTINGEQFFIGGLQLNNPDVQLVIQSSPARTSTDLVCIRDISSIGLIRIAGNPSTSNNAVLQINASGRSISGTGELRLEEFGDSHLIINLPAGGTFTNIDHRITGAGTLRGSGGTLVNSGTILANRPGGMLITCPLRNLATVRAVGPGALTINSTVVSQEGPTALLEADATTLTIADATDLNGGTVRGINGGVVTLSAGTVTMSGVTSEGDWVIPALAGSLNTSLSVDSGWTNNALVRLPASATTNHNRLYIATNVISGTGEVRLEKAVGADFILNVGDGWVTNGPGHSITGTGWIGTASGLGTLINEGTIRADRDGDLTVQLPLLDNRGAVRIVAPGSMRMNAVVTQMDWAFIEADGATLTFTDGPAGDPLVSGGTVRAVNGGVVRVPCALVIAGVTSDGDWTVEPAAPGGGGTTPDLRIMGSWTNNGLIDLPAGWHEPRLISILTDGLTIEGDGEVRLGEPGWSRLQLPEGGTATNGSGHTISGVGTIVAGGGGPGATLRNAGILAPGALLGALTMNANLLQLPTGVIEIELQGDGAEQRDLLNVNGYAVALAGTLRVRATDGYVVPACEEITVVRGNLSGFFDALDLPALPQGLMHVTYASDRVSIGYIPGDLNGDGLLDFGDYLEFLNLFDAMDPRADLNGDGLADFGDYLEFLNLFNMGC